MYGKQFRHLNRRGKIAVIILLGLILLTAFKVAGSGEGDNTQQESVEPASLDGIKFSPISMTAFADSNLKQSIIEERLQEKKEIAERNEKEEDVIYLTFDDGPTSHTSELLDILNDYHAQATFFMIGPHIVFVNSKSSQMFIQFPSNCE